MTAVTADQALGIVNGHQLAERYAADTGKPMPPVIYYRAATHGLASRAGRWVVFRPGFRTDPKCYEDGGNKTFQVWRRDRAEQFELAKAWAGNRYQVGEWVRVSLVGGAFFVPVPVADWLKAELKLARRTGKI